MSAQEKSDLRKVERLLREKRIETDPKNLLKGDIFRLFEPDGNPVLYNGRPGMVASSDIRLSDELLYYIGIESND